MRFEKGNSTSSSVDQALLLVTRSRASFTTAYKLDPPCRKSPKEIPR